MKTPGTDRRESLLGAASIAAVLAVFVLVRLPLLTVEGSARGWNGDSAIFGLMAKKIHDGAGFDVFFWGQNYMGPLTPALAAGIRRVFLDPAGIGVEGGPIALRLASMGEIALGICIYVLAFGPLFGRVIAAAAGFWMAIGPPFFVRLSALHKSGLGPEMSFLLGSLLFLLAANVLKHPRPVVDGFWGRFAFGLIAGIGWWMNQTIVFVLLPAAAVVLLRPGRRGARDTAPLVVGALVGYAPVWLGRLLGWYEPAAGPVVPPWRLADAPVRLVHFVGGEFWRLTGLEGLAPAPVLVGAAAVLLAGLLAATRRARRPGVAESGRPRAPAAGLLLVASIAALAAAALVFMNVDPAQLRYVTPALPPVLALLAVAFSETTRLLRRRAPAALVAAASAGLALLVAVFLWRQAGRTVADILLEPDSRPTVEAIVRQGYTVCHAGYDTSYTLQFLSDERVRFIPYHSPDRNRALSARLRALPGPQCLVMDDGSAREWLPSDAALEGGPARRRVGTR